MTLRIFKYPLEITDTQKLSIPKGARILHIAAQHNEPKLWAIVDDTEPLHPIVIHTLGTGHDATRTATLTYIGSYLLDNGGFVFHVFIDPTQL